jgi:hypothetical protein
MSFSIYTKTDNHNNLASLHLVNKYLNLEDVNIYQVNSAQLDISQLHYDLLDTSTTVICLNCYIPLSQYEQLLDAAELAATLDNIDFDRMDYKLSILHEVTDSDSLLNFDYYSGFTNPQLDEKFGSLKYTLTINTYLSIVLNHYLHTRITHNSDLTYDVFLLLNTDYPLFRRSYIDLISIYERNLTSHPLYEEAKWYINAIPPPSYFKFDIDYVDNQLEVQEQLYNLDKYYSDSNLTEIISNGTIIEEFKSWNSI